MNSHAEQLDVGKMEEKSKASIVKSKHDTDVLEHVGKLLHKHLQKHVAKISRVFNEFDTSGDGRVDKKEFSKGIASIVGSHMTKDEISTVWKFVDKDGGGTVDYMEFVETLRQLDSTKVKGAAKRAMRAEHLAKNNFSKKNQLERQKKLQELKNKKSTSITTLGSDVDAVEEVGKRVKKYLAKNMARAIDLFRKMDTSGDGYLDKEEMENGLTLLGLKMVKKDFDLFWKSIDEDDGGYVDTNELLTALGTKSSINKLKLKRPSKKYREPLRRMKLGQTKSGSLGWLNQGHTASQKHRQTRRRYKKKYYKNLPNTPPTFFPTGSVRYKNVFERCQSTGGLKLPNIHDNTKIENATKIVRRPVVIASATQRVLRCIAMREGLLRQIYEMLPKRISHKWTKKSHTQPPKIAPMSELFERETRLNSTGNLIFELKSINTQTVEAIHQWRSEQAKLLSIGESHQALAALRVAGSEPSIAKDGSADNFPLVFTWNGQNYLIKMCTDSNFLHSWRKYLVKACVTEIQTRYTRRKAMEIAVESKQTGDGGILDKIQHKVLVKLLKQKDNFVEMFNKHDKSGDGQLQRSELVSVFSDLGLHLSKADLSELFFALDRDGNGEVDTKELLRGLEDTKAAQVIENNRFEEAEDILRNEWIIVHGGDPNREHDHAKGPEEEEMKTELCRLMYHAQTEYALSSQIDRLHVVDFKRQARKQKKNTRKKEKPSMSRR
jgi:Ca2+-binding EF-hand superfamily protein